MTTLSIPGLSLATKRPGLRGVTTLGAGRLSTSDQPRYLAIVGNKTSAGSLTADGQVVEVRSPEQIDAYAGAGSELACGAYIALLLGVRVFIAAVAEASGGAAGTATATFTGTATSTGTLRGRVGNTDWEQVIASGTTAAAAAAALEVVLAQYTRMPATPDSSGAAMTLTSKNVGARNNSLALYVDQTDMPSGLTVALTGGSALPTVGKQTGVRFTGASGADNVTNILAVLKTTKFDTIAAAQIDSTNAGKWKAHCAALAAIGEQKYTMYCLGSNGTYSAAQTLTTGTLNDAFGQVLLVEDSENSGMEIAASMGTLRQYWDALHPNKSFAGRVLPGLRALVAATSIPDDAEIEVGLNNGVTMAVTAGLEVLCVESITTHCLTVTGGSISDFRTYRTGEARTAFRVFEAIQLLWEGEVAPANEYVSDDLPDGKQPDVNVITPTRWRGIILRLLLDLETLHWVTNVNKGNNLVVVQYDNTFKGLLAQVNIEVQPVNTKTGLEVRQYASFGPSPSALLLPTCRRRVGRARPRIVQRSWPRRFIASATSLCSTTPARSEPRRAAA